MSIFDKLRGQLTPQSPAPTAPESNSKKETFTFAELPESLTQLQALPEAALTSPFQTAALTVCALCAYGAEPSVGIEMLNWLKGPRPLTNYEISFLLLGSGAFDDVVWGVNWPLSLSKIDMAFTPVLDL